MSSDDDDDDEYIIHGKLLDPIQEGEFRVIWLSKVLVFFLALKVFLEIICNNSMFND